jgi:hypothetical protein
MNIELKKAIINSIFENIKIWNLVKNTVEEFRPYIYNDKGSYLIGGEQVYNFIKESVNLITK